MVTWQLPAATVALQVFPVPSLTVTLPVNVPAPGEFTVTAKFTVIVCPTVEGLGVFAVIVVVVLALFTVKAAVPLLVACVASAGKVAVTVCGLVPTFEGVTEAVHVAAFAPLGARVHGPKVSPASEELSVRAPVGLVRVPESVSVTVTVALLPWPTTTLVRDRVTLVVVARLLTVCDTPADVLVEKLASPVGNVAVSVWAPDVVGIN
jgi:hypothetical protein